MRHARRLIRAITSGIVLAALVTASLPALPAAAVKPLKVTGAEVSTVVDGQKTVALPITASHVAFRLPAHEAVGNLEPVVTVAFGMNEAELGEEVPLVHDEDSVGEDGSVYSGVIWTGGARFVRITTDQPLPNVDVVAIDAQADKGLVDAPIAAVANGAVNQPSIIRRSGWGADESLRFDSGGNETWPPSFSPMQKAIVHHTAGRNNDPNPAATVRAIYYMYAISRDYGDIGYNFLIDEQGRIYEGRYSRPYAAGETPTGEDLAGNVVRGAHARDYNDANVGIVLLGTFQNRQPTSAARLSLEKLLAWKLERHGINPKGSSTYVNPVLGNTKFIPNISGHRQVNQTACPGDTFFPTFPQLRQRVADQIAATTGAGNDSNPPVVNSLKPLYASSGSLTIPFGLIFNEPITGLDESDFDLGGTSDGWSVDSITGSGSTYTVYVVGDNPDDGTIELTLPPDSVTDLAGHDGPNSPATGQAVYAQDGDSPTVGLYHTPHKTYINNFRVDYIDITATFSEPVTGFVASDVAIGGTSHGWEVPLIFGSGASYGFSVANPGWASGTLTIQVPAGAVTDLAGNPVQASNLVTLIMDKARPTTSQPWAQLRSGVTLGAKPQIRLDWTGHDVGPAGIHSYQIARSVNGGKFFLMASGLQNSELDVWPIPGRKYRYEIRARDKAGNFSWWKLGPTIRPRLFQQKAAQFTGSSAKSWSSGYSGGSERHLLTAGSSARLTTQARSLSFVTTLGPNRGSAQIYVDGVLEATVNLNAPALTYRYVAFSKSWSSVGTHTIRVVALGTPGHPRVDVDAFGVIR